MLSRFLFDKQKHKEFILMRIHCSSEFKKHALEDRDDPQNLFDAIFNLQGEVYKKIDNRVTQRLLIEDQPYFIKTHRGVGWREIFKNLFFGRLPIISAMNEVRALEFLSMHEICSLEVAGYGWKGFNPATRRSFLITKSVENTESLQEFAERLVGRTIPWRLKLALIRVLAETISHMHRVGLNHRDCYLVHFRIPNALEESAQHVQENPKMVVMDLHRAQIRTKVPHRWQVKDLAGLYFSAHSFFRSKRDRLRFIKWYTGQSLRDTLSAPLWRNIEIKVQNYDGKYRKKNNASPTHSESNSGKFN